MKHHQRKKKTRKSLGLVCSARRSVSKTIIQSVARKIPPRKLPREKLRFMMNRDHRLLENLLGQQTLPLVLIADKEVVVSRTAVNAIRKAEALIRCARKI